MDDFVLWHDDAATLTEWQEAIGHWLAVERGLELKLRPGPELSGDGLPFLGYRVMGDGRLLLGDAARKRFRRRLSESAFAEGRISEGSLQRRVDALLSFTAMAECQDWRRKVIFPNAPDFGKI